MVHARRMITLHAALVNVCITALSCAPSKPPVATLEAAREQPIDPFGPSDARPKGSDAAECVLLPVYFAFDSSDLDAQARESLARWFRCALAKPITPLRVIGMTDPRGTEEYNLALGERRASACTRYLLALSYLGGIVTTSAGEERSGGQDEDGWAGDRRAEFEPIVRPAKNE